MVHRRSLLVAVVTFMFLSTGVFAAGSTRVYLPLVLNTGSAPTPEPPAPVPATVVVLSSSTYTSGSDTRWIVGEVQNNTSRNVRFVKIVASQYAAGGTFIGSDFGYTDIDILRPGQRSPFRVLIWDAPTNFDHYTLQVQWQTTTEQPVDGVTILSQNTRSASFGDWMYIYGQVRNDSGGPLKFVKIVATLYDASGTVVGADYGYTDLDELANGQTSPYEILVMRWVNVARYELQVQARRP